MQKFVELTGVELFAMRQAAKEVQQAIDHLGLKTSQRTHSYWQFVSFPFPFTFGTKVIPEESVGAVHINRVTYCFGPTIRQDLSVVRQGTQMLVDKGLAPSDISVSEMMRFHIIDQLSHEFAHAFGVRPEVGRFAGLDPVDVERITDAVAIWAIPPNDPRGSRKLIITGFTRLDPSKSVAMANQEVKAVARDVLDYYKLLPQSG
jgi:hypothetical protein